MDHKDHIQINNMRIKITIRTPQKLVNNNNKGIMNVLMIKWMHNMMRIRNKIEIKREKTIWRGEERIRIWKFIRHHFKKLIRL